MTAPIKTCDFCNATGVMPTFMDGTTVCYDCLPKLPKTLKEAWREMVSLRKKTEAMESRIELLEHDAKSGDYETLYAQTVAELAQLSKDADKFDDGIDWVQRALQAEARIEAMEKQKPAYWGPKHAIEGGSTTVIVGKFPVNPTDTPLYALPGAKGK